VSSSCAIRVARKLLEEKARVVVTDPKVLDNARCDLAGQTDVIGFADDPYEAAQGARMRARS
jgi:UDPglucose 6-dehydrogenase